MYKLSGNKNNKHIIPGIFGLAGLGIIIFFVWQLLLSIGNDSENLFSIKNDSVVLGMQNAEIENFKKSYQDYTPNLEKMNQLFIDPQNPVNFIVFLENTAHDSGITSKISLMPDSDKNTATFQLFSSDDFLKILDFSERLEHGPYLVEIENVEMKSQQSTDDKNHISGNVDATFSIKAFAKQ